MDMKPTRDGFGEELVVLGKEKKNIVVVSADLEDATRAEYFKKEFPDRFFTFGIAEQNMVSAAAGLSSLGFVTFANSFAIFLSNRAFDQIRIDICLSKANVKLVGSHMGLTVGEDGATAQSLEDVALMRVLPNMTVVCPMDSLEAKKATRALAEMKGPAYLRTSRAPFPILSKESDPFILGKAKKMREGTDVTIIASGLMVYESLQAAEMLKVQQIEARVINMHTIKPIDEEIIIESAKKTRAIVTAEEHQVAGGLGSAVAEVLVQKFPVPIEMVAVRDSFGESGTPQELLKKYHLKDVDIAEAVKKVLKRK